VGSVIGAAYASGVSIKELEEMASQVRFKDFSRLTLSRFGLFSNDKMAIFLHRVLRCKTFEELQIPLAVTATDIVTGEPAVFTSGELIDPVRASCAYPGMFHPVKVGSRLLVDGLLATRSQLCRCVTWSRARDLQLSCRQLVKPGGPRHVLDVIGQCFAIAQEKTCGPWKLASDVIVEPAIGQFAYDDFVRAADIIRAGEAAARVAMPAIREWLPAGALENKLAPEAQPWQPSENLHSVQ